MANYGNTTKYLLRKLLGTSLGSEIDDGIRALADDVDANMAGYAEGTFAGRPAAGKAGRLYRTTDTSTVYVDTGSAWIPAGSAPGDLKASALSAAPTGWLLADGSVISRTGVNAALFAAIGTAYGTGDGSTTFGIPDLRGRTPFGEDTAGLRLGGAARLRGNVGGEDVHTLTVGEIPSHSHVRDYTSQPSGSAAGANGLFTPVSSLGNVLADTRNTGGGGVHNNMPPYQVVNWMVKL